ncbi:fimbrial protein [uncultured Porphyromonas sp.]|uniref:fimbrial protein n=1 Tax=uncultured Porphyromonas sp. TaxID=159274 RepID=UPI00261460E3|nr:fimbrial protein [uncultured Porphyromonas sp.]
MRPNNSRFVASLGALLLLALSLVGCQDTLLDRTQPDPASPEQIGDDVTDRLDGAVTVSLSYDTPALRLPHTRALSVEQESELKLATTRVMIFKDNGDYQYDAPLTKIDRSTTDKQQGTLTVQIKPGKGLEIVVLANLSETEKVRKVTGTKADILKSFEYSMSQTTDFATTGLPMWGEVTQVTVDQSAGAVPSIGKTIHLLRAVARVDVGLKMSAVGTSGKDSDFDETASDLISTIVEPADKSSMKVKWTLEETKFYNASSKGLVAPAEGKYTLSEDKPRATAPTLPAEPGKQDLSYTAESNLLKRVIYVPETDNPAPTATQSGTETTPEEQSQYLARPYLIVKLSYKEVDESNNVKAGGAEGTTYFRIDFLKREGEEATAKYTYLPLLRNYRYKVDIQNIGGLGFDNEDDAKKGPSANIMYNVLVWDESEMSNVKYDGQYMLGVSKNMVKTYKSGGSMQFNVQTSWPKGFKIEGLPKGFTVSPAAIPDGGAANTFETTEEVTLSLTPPANWDPDPDGEVKKDEEGKEYKEVTLTVVAGRMKWNVQVRQYQFDKVDIQLFHDRDLTRPLEFLTIHELGKAMLDPSITDYKLANFDNKMYYGTNQKYIEKYGDPATTKAPWFDMDKANKDAGSESDFTALTSGAVRVFYARIDAPAGATVDFAPSDGGKKLFTVKDITSSDTSLPANVRMYMVTAEEMTDLHDFFEVKSQEYVFTVKSSSGGKELTAEAPINFDQREYDAAIFVDQEMNDPLFGDSKHPVFLMNGETLNYKLRSNANYYRLVLRQRGSEVTPPSSKNADGTLVEGAEGILKINGESWKTPVTGDANFKGDPFTITLRDDLKDSKVIRGYADIEAKVLGMPFHFYKARENTVGLISADFVEENHVANSYQLVVDGGGLFIPIEKWINDAAEEYNSQVTVPFRNFSNPDKAGFSWSQFMEQNQLQGISPLDDPYSELLWTDAFYHPNTPTDGKVVGSGSNTAFVAHEIVDYNGKLYLFVKPGSLPGNSVIAIRSTTREPKIPYTDSIDDIPYYHSDPAKNKAILWSFHFVVYPKTINTAKILNHVLYVQDKNNEDYLTIIKDVTRRFFNRNYGALISADEEGGQSKHTTVVGWRFDKRTHATKVYRNTKYEAQGMGYQWGRKDPVPLIAENLSHDFYNEYGKQVRFTLAKSRQADPAKTIAENKMSVRETIERPMYFVPGNKGIAQGNWMTEFGYAPEFYVAAENSSWQGSRIWGGNGNVNDSNQRSNTAQSTRKTHFDPSPYGFAVPTSGFEFGRYFMGSELTAHYRCNLHLLMANALCTPDRSFTQFTSEVKMKWLVSNCYETRDAPTTNLDASVSGLANNASATNRSSLTPYRPALQMECLSDWKTVNKIPLGNDAINRTPHLDHEANEYEPFYY